MVQEAKEIKEIAARYHVPFVINDDIYAAKEINADGVHIGQSDMEYQKAREILGPDKIIGVSAGNLEQAVAAEKAGADYIGVGAVFTTSTKLDHTRITFETLKEIHSPYHQVVLPSAESVLTSGQSEGDRHRWYLCHLGNLWTAGSGCCHKGSAPPHKGDALMKSIKNAGLYIFDMDGTLLDSMGEWTHLGRNYLLSKGITPPADLEETIDAMTMDESAAYFQTLGIHGDISTINREIMELIHRSYRYQIPLEPGIKELLQELSTKKDSILCVLTTSERDCAVNAFQRLGILSVLGRHIPALKSV